MTTEDRKALYELFQKFGKSAIDIFAKEHNYSRSFVEKELEEMIDFAYDMVA